MNIHSRPDKSLQILDAAVEAFAEFGFHGAAIPVIANRAGVAAGSIYRYFNSKEHLLNAAYRQRLLGYASVLRGIENLEVSRRSQFRDGWRRLAGMIRRDPVSFRFLELHDYTGILTTETEQLRSEAVHPIRIILERSTAEGHLKAIPTELQFSLFWGALTGFGKLLASVPEAAKSEYIEQSSEAIWDLIQIQTAS